MKDVMREKYSIVKGILSKHGVTFEDVREVLDIIQGLCYRWAEANALASACDEFLRERMSTDEYNTAFSPMGIVHEITERINDTYPEEWLEVDPEEPEEGETYE